MKSFSHFVQVLCQLPETISKLPERFDTWWTYHIVLHFFCIDAVTCEPTIHKPYTGGLNDTDERAVKSRNRILKIIRARGEMLAVWRASGSIRSKPAPWPQPLGLGDDDGTICINGEFTFVDPIQRSPRLVLQSNDPLSEEIEVARLSLELEEAQRRWAHRLQFLADRDRSVTKVASWREAHA